MTPVRSVLAAALVAAACAAPAATAEPWCDPDQIGVEYGGFAACTDRPDQLEIVCKRPMPPLC